MAASIPIALSKGGTVSARHYEADDARATLVFAHGAGAGQTHPFIVRLASSLAARAIEVFTFNFPYIERKRGAPDPAPVLEACYLDVVRAVAEQIHKRLLFIGGKSMGGRIATMIAARPEFAGVAGIIVLGYPLHPPGKPGVLRVAHLSAIRVPMLVVQGTRDAFGSPDELAPYFRTNARVHAIANGDHSLVVPKSSARSQADVNQEIDGLLVSWMTERR